MKLETKNYALFFYAALVLFFLMQILALARHSPVWWDEAVYVSMGKYIFSGGESGMWEEIRPPAVPILLGMLWKLGLNPLFSGRAVAFLFSIGAVILTYLIGKRAFGEKEGVIAAVMLAFTNVFFYFNTLLLSDIISLFFALSAVYVFISKKSEKGLLASGIFAALSFLARFPQAIIAAAIVLSLAISEKPDAKSVALKLKNAANKMQSFFFGFLLLAVPYLLANYYLYGSVAKPFFAANKIITESYSWIYDLGYLYYFKQLALENLFLVLAVPAAIYFAKEKLWRKREKAVVFIAPLLLFAYFTLLNHKEARYVIVFLPYLFIAASYGFFEVKKRAAGHSYGTVLSVVLIILAAGVFGSLLFRDADRIKYIEDSSQFEKNLSRIDFGRGPVFSTTPIVGIYSDARILPIYYSLTYAQNNFEAIHNAAGFVVFNTCDFPCQAGDARCPQEISKLVSDIKENSMTVYYMKDANCEYYVFGKERGN